MAEDTPKGPTGVWIEYADGGWYANVPTVFVGIDDEGCAQFEVIPPREEAPVAMGAVEWPGKTSLIIPKLQARPKTVTGGIVPPYITDEIPGHEDDQP